MAPMPQSQGTPEPMTPPPPVGNYEPTMARPIPTGGFPAQDQYPQPGQYPPAGQYPQTGMGFYGYPPQPPGSQPMPSQQPQRRRIWPWAIAGVALLCVVGLVVGGVIRWVAGDDNDAERQALLPGQLTGAYPSAPSAAWTVTASDAGGEQFLSVDPSRSAYGTVGAVTDGTHLVTMVGSRSSSEGRRVVGVNPATGEHWTAARAVKGCSDAIVDGQIACYDESTVTFFDAATGRVTATAASPSSTAYEIALNGDAAYLRDFGGGSGSMRISKISRQGQAEWTKAYTLMEGAPGGDSSSFTATPALVASAQTSLVVVSAVDGREILNRPGFSTLETLPDGSIAAVSGTGSGGTFQAGPVVVVRSDGTVVEIPGRAVAAATVATPEQRDHLLVAGKWTSASTAQSSWATSLSGESYELSAAEVIVADNREILTRVGQQIVASDTVSGRQIWTSDLGTGSGYQNTGVTDGARLIAGDSVSGLQAVNLTDGSSAWNLPSSALGATSNTAPQVFAVGKNLVTLTGTTITGFAPTGGDATVPGAPTTQAPAPEGSVTHCSSAPTFTPEKFRTTSAGLVATMKVVATCPDGDVMSGAATRISISDAGKLVASGLFDFSRAPTAIPSSDDDASITLDLTYPPGSFYRTPDTLGQANGTASGQFTVDCDPGAQTTNQLPAPQSGSTAPPITATGPAVPAGTDIVATTGDALRAQADSDRAFILANLNNRWVAQLSSKRPGLYADGKTWDNQAILDEFLGLRLRFNDVRLLYSTEWSVFSQPGWWVTVAALTFPGPDQANAWCSAQGFDGDHCFAKLVSTTASADGSTRYR